MLTFPFVGFSSSRACVFFERDTKHFVTFPPTADAILCAFLVGWSVGVEPTYAVTRHTHSAHPETCKSAAALPTRASPAPRLPHPPPRLPAAASALYYRSASQRALSAHRTAGDNHHCCGRDGVRAATLGAFLKRLARTQEGDTAPPRRAALARSC